MTTKEIADLASIAGKSGLSTILQLKIAAILLSRGESTLISLANELNLKLEPVAAAAASLQTHGGASAIVCREAVGFSLIKLTPSAESSFRQLITATPPLLRRKNLEPR